MPQIYVCSFFLSLYLFSLFQFFYIYILLLLLLLLLLLCLCVLYVYRPCWETYKISSRFESCLYLYFIIFYFCIVELWVLVNLFFFSLSTEKKISTYCHNFTVLSSFLTSKNKDLQWTSKKATNVVLILKCLWTSKLIFPL